MEQGSNKLLLLSKVSIAPFLLKHLFTANPVMVLYNKFGTRQILAVTVRFIQKDAEEKKASFNARPYFRLFVNWLLDLGCLDPVIDGANFQVWIY